MAAIPRSVAARQRAVRRALARGAMPRSELLAATRIQATLLSYTLRTLGDEVIVIPHPRGNLYALAGSVYAQAAAAAAPEAEAPRRDWRIAVETLAPGHRRVRFGDHWRPGTAQRANTRHAGGMCSLSSLAL